MIQMCSQTQNTQSALLEGVSHSKNKNRLLLNCISQSPIISPFKVRKENVDSKNKTQITFVSWWPSWRIQTLSFSPAGTCPTITTVLCHCLKSPWLRWQTRGCYRWVSPWRTAPARPPALCWTDHSRGPALSLTILSLPSSPVSISVRPPPPPPPPNRANNARSWWSCTNLRPCV